LEYTQPMEVYAVVFGYLIRTFGKIQTSKVNKIVSELGYDTLTVPLLREYAETIEDDPELSEILNKAVNGDVTPDELKKYKTDTNPIKSEKDIHKVVTPYQVEHQKVLKNNREFNKIQREGAYVKILFEEMKEELKKEFRSIPFREKKPFEYKYDPTNNTVVVIVSDWHIGASVSDTTHHGGYNLAILEARIDYLVNEAQALAHEHQAEKIVCIFAGDLIEGADMRGGQKWGLELNLSQQIAVGVRKLYELLEDLSDIAPVEFLSIRGNHDRLTGQANKKDNIYNDSSMYIVLDMLKMKKEEGNLPGVHIIDNAHDMYDGELEIYGKVFHVSHGDALKGGTNPFTKFIEDRPINYLITGHIHTFSVKQYHRDYMHLVVGSPMGYNDYAKELKLTKTAPSQTLMVMREGKDTIIQPVFMEHINLRGAN